MDGGALWATVHEVAESDTTERLHFTSLQPHINQELRLKINSNYNNNIKMPCYLQHESKYYLSLEEE